MILGLGGGEEGRCDGRALRLGCGRGVIRLKNQGYALRVYQLASWLSDTETLCASGKGWG